MTTIDEDRATVQALRKAAHEADMNKIFKDHKGHHSLGTHHTGWATASRIWMAAANAFEKKWGTSP